MFQGFDDATVDFMWGIRFNNEKSWFEQNKQQYLDHFYNPMRELCGELYDFLQPQLKGIGTVSKVSRIYRDARRLRGRGPYKDHLWLSIERPHGPWEPEPCFWFELGPEGWSYGMGSYAVKPLTMAKLRARMEADPAEMEKLTRRLNRQSEFVLEGEEYKKPKPGAPNALLEPWFWKKNYTVWHQQELTDELFSREIVERLKTGFAFLLPYYRYVVTLDGDPDPRDA